MTPHVELPERGLNLNETLDAIETIYIEKALEKTEGNITKAAQLLGLQRTTLRAKITSRGVNYVGDLQPATDPLGEFTIEKSSGARFFIKYKGEIISSNYSLRAANKALRKKMRE